MSIINPSVKHNSTNHNHNLTMSTMSTMSNSHKKTLSSSFLNLLTLGLGLTCLILAVAAFMNLAHAATAPALNVSSVGTGPGTGTGPVTRTGTFLLAQNGPGPGPAKPQPKPQPQPRPQSQPQPAIPEAPEVDNPTPNVTIPNNDKVMDYWATATDLNSVVATKLRLQVQFQEADREESRLREELTRTLNAICPAGYEPKVAARKFTCNKIQTQAQTPTSGKPPEQK